MGFLDDLTSVSQDPAMLRFAMRRAGDPELALDAVQMTWWNVARVAPETIRDLRAFFCTALKNEIMRQRMQVARMPTEDIAEHLRDEPSPGEPPPDGPDDQAAHLVLARTLLARLDHDRDLLMASIPGRSPEPQRYRSAMFAAAAKILCLLLAGEVTKADWNDVLRSEYPQYCGEPQLACDAIHQRLSRARRDVRLVLSKVVLRSDLVF